MHTNHPGYDVVVREVDLTREKGETEALKVGSVIGRDLLAAAALEGVFVGEGLTGLSTQMRAPRTGATTAPGMTGRRSTMNPRGARATELNPPAPSFPVPLPFPRPHP
jgi:hypothetical protein